MNAQPKAPGQNIDQLFALPEGQARLVDDLIGTEQWLQNVGAREIVTGIASGDSNDIRRGASKLKAALEREHERGRTSAAHTLANVHQELVLERALRVQLEDKFADARAAVKWFCAAAAVAGAIGGWCLALAIS